MAEELLGGLNSYKSEPAPEVLSDQPQEEVAPAPTKVVGTTLLDKSLSDYEKQSLLLNQQIQKMVDSYGTRTGSTVNPKLAALSEGLGTDTPFFSTAFSKGIAGMAKAESEEEKQRREDAKMRLELMKMSADMSKSEMTRQLMGQLADAVANSDTEKVNAINLQLAKVTGDPKYAEAISAETARKVRKQAFSSIFPTKEVTDPKTGEVKKVMEFNPSALSDLLKKSDDPAKLSKEIAETAKEFRKNRMLGGDLGAEATPFDALAMMGSTPEIKAQAKYLAKQYQSGILDEDKANTLAQQMMQTNTSHMDRETAMYNNKVMQELQLDLKRDAAEQKKITKANEQKVAFDSAQDMMDQVDKIRQHKGRYSSIGKFDPRRVVPGTDEYDFDQELVTLKSKQFLASIQNMRGMGALSDAEGRKVESALAALNPGMSRKSFNDSLDMIDKYMTRAKDNAARIARGEPPIFTDPKTGKEYEGKVPPSWGEKTINAKPSESAPAEATPKGEPKVIRYDAQGKRIS
jgi:hypothetical protein